MADRKAGWYWGKDGLGWEPLRWSGCLWDGHVNDADLEEIGQRIPDPDEPWQCVPVELIGWVRGAQELMREMPGDWPATANQADMLLSATPKPEE